eukprot:scaffold1753_cov153-Amphora_coffeaeformis.AAC.4
MQVKHFVYIVKAMIIMLIDEACASGASQSPVRQKHLISGHPAQQPLMPSQLSVLLALASSAHNFWDRKNTFATVP